MVAGDAAGQRHHRADDARAFVEVLQAMTFERRAAQAQASSACEPANTKPSTDARLGAHSGITSASLSGRFW
jgi:hypothetical protein